MTFTFPKCAIDVVALSMFNSLNEPWRTDVEKALTAAAEAMVKEGSARRGEAMIFHSKTFSKENWSARTDGVGSAPNFPVLIIRDGKGET
jgi:hypothetical protein